MKLDLSLYLKHKVTAYHFRRNHSDEPSLLALCHCGWKSKFHRDPPSVKLRRTICLIRGHKWGKEEHTGSFGEIDHTEETADYVWHFRQCDFCYKCEDIR